MSLLLCAIEPEAMGVRVRDVIARLRRLGTGELGETGAEPARAALSSLLRVVTILATEPFRAPRAKGASGGSSEERRRVARAPVGSEIPAPPSSYTFASLT